MTEGTRVSDPEQSLSMKQREGEDLLRQEAKTSIAAPVS
jgi:hypothetical protein